MADLEFKRVQDDPPLYDLRIAGKLVGQYLTMDEVIATIHGKGDLV